MPEFNPNRPSSEILELCGSCHPLRESTVDFYTNENPKDWELGVGMDPRREIAIKAGADVLMVQLIGPSDPQSYHFIITKVAPGGTGYFNRGATIQIPKYLLRIDPEFKPPPGLS